MSDQHDPTPSQQAVRDLYANGTDPMAMIAKYRDQIADLSDHFQSYRTLERMAAEEGVDSHDESARESSAELSALLRVINNQVESQLEKMAQTALELQNEAAKGRRKT